LIGNWITPDTTVKEIADFAERVYLRHDFKGFTGDRKFLRDDQAQKAFSKLRSSIAGVYAWRLGMSSGSPTPVQYLPKTDAQRQRMIKEADFAFRQAFAFCPYSPEAVFRYVQLLANMGRMDDAILVAETCQKLDTFNLQVAGLVQQLKSAKERPSPLAQVESDISRLEAEVRSSPSNFQKVLDLAIKYIQIQQTDKATQLLDAMLENPKLDAQGAFAVAQVYAQLNNLPKLEAALKKLVQLAPEEPEAWYNLAATRAALARPTEALQDLKRSLDLNSKRMASNPKSHDLRAEAEKDARFNSLKALPEFKTITAPK
jgi:tetratricopeptide (TPR) repeat protein